MPEDGAGCRLDDRLLDILLAELGSPGPVFIYANKNGAHFPYDTAIPASRDDFQPTMAADRGRPASRAELLPERCVAGRVDRFFKRLLDEIDLADTAVIYTSDHGQLFDPRRLRIARSSNPIRARRWCRS